MRELNDNSNNPDDQVMSELNKQYNQADEQKENKNKSDQSEHKGNRITKLVVGILMIVNAAMLPGIAFLIGTLNLFSGAGGLGGTACFLLSLFWLASGIVLIATHNHVDKKAGEIAVLVMMILSWLLAVYNSSFYVFLSGLGWTSFFIGLGFFFWKELILNISKKGKIIFWITSVIALFLGCGLNVVAVIHGHDALNRADKNVKEFSKGSDKADKELKKADQSMKRADDAMNGNDKATKKRLAKYNWNPKTLTLTTDKATIRETYASVQPDSDPEEKKSDLIVYLDITNTSNKPQEISDLFNYADDSTVEAIQKTDTKISSLDTADGTQGSTEKEVSKRTDNMDSDDKVLPGKTTKGIMLWELKNTTSPVTLKFKAEKGLGYTTIGKQTIPLQR